MSEVHCFYHKADLDGKCSGAIVKNIHPEAIMHPIDYGDEFPYDKVVKHGNRIIMVDFSLPMDRMIYIREGIGKPNNFCWIDHHVSAIKERDLHKLEFEGIQEVGRAACELCWEWFYQEHDIPDAIYLLGRYDVWDLSVKNAMPFQYGMRLTKDTRPESNSWVPIIDGDADVVEDLIEVGKMILRFKEIENEGICRAYSFEREVEGKICLCLNSHGNSQSFDSMYDPEKHDIMFKFANNGKAWNVSLYSTKEDVDCSIIAKKFGGGGHKGAAGFQCQTLPFEITK